MDTWKMRHFDAMDNPSGPEIPIVRMVYALVAYADHHRDRYESTIGHDYVLGPAFRAMCDGFLTLLNGETGRLDCGTLDAAIRNLCAEHDVELP